MSRIQKFTGGRLGCYIEISIFTPMILWCKHYSDVILDHYLSTSSSFISWLAMPARHTILTQHYKILHTQNYFHHGEPWPTPIKIYFQYIKWWLNKIDFCRRREGSRDKNNLENYRLWNNFFRHRQIKKIAPKLWRDPPKLFILHPFILYQVYQQSNDLSLQKRDF